MAQEQLSASAGYELFRRAIVEREDEAWAAIHMHFRPLLISWARTGTARPASACHCEDLADRALARAWSALTAEQFAQFPSLAALLGYLRTCVGAAVIDAVRAETTRERAYQKLDLPVVATPEELVLGAQNRDELWRLVNTLITSAHERIILIDSFVLGLPPRVILERYPDYFTSIPIIYSAKRNLLNRLARSRDLRLLYRDLRAAR
jgi:DNA-directed RNA polymerase specialized sigma24 family protein